jgi:hypothetical protein
MATQPIDLGSTTEVNFNGQPVEKINLDNTTIWTKPASGPNFYSLVPATSGARQYRQASVEPAFCGSDSKQWWTSLSGSNGMYVKRGALAIYLSTGGYAYLNIRSSNGNPVFSLGSRGARGDLTITTGSSGPDPYVLSTGGFNVKIYNATGASGFSYYYNDSGFNPDSTYAYTIYTSGNISNNDDYYVHSISSCYNATYADYNENTYTPWIAEDYSSTSLIPVSELINGEWVMPNNSYSLTRSYTPDFTDNYGNVTPASYSHYLNGVINGRIFFNTLIKGLDANVTVSQFRTGNNTNYLVVSYEINPDNTSFDVYRNDVFYETKDLFVTSEKTGNHLLGLSNEVLA